MGVRLIPLGTLVRLCVRWPSAFRIHLGLADRAEKICKGDGDVVRREVITRALMVEAKSFLIFAQNALLYQ